MKLRIQNDTLRVRLNEKEVSDLNNGKLITSQTHFLEDRLEFQLKSGQQDNVIMHGSNIEITVSEVRIGGWATSDQVTLAMNFDVNNDKKLSILVEKDMKV